MWSRYCFGAFTRFRLSSGLGPLTRFYNFHQDLKILPGYVSSGGRFRLSENLRFIHNAGHLIIAFTCKVCSHRSTKIISKQAYNNGVVIIQCSCKNHHLIADHLGWFRDNRVTIEDLMLERGEKVLKYVQEDKTIHEWTPNVIQEETKSFSEGLYKLAASKEE
ncbi:489_t:CDS:2 [Scutellospora calospora]|uniref:489_t:CDS:1 n=1 Tax=Scutellospora calospora TaxID=85575 RepID=A0ACA9JTN7_9GLOM|nr:489_t:CDS:2 [Scutellospora calospora]